MTDPATEDYFAEPFDVTRATNDPPYSLAWSQEDYKDSVRALQELVIDHITSGYAGASSFVRMLETQTNVISEKLRRIQLDLGRVNQMNNSDWM